MADLLPDKLEPTSLESQTKQIDGSARVREVIAQALAGTLPRSRELTQWQPERLSPTHINMIIDRATLGLTVSEIAEKYDYTTTMASHILRHPDSEYIIATLVGTLADRMTDPAERLRGYAGEAVSEVVTIMRASKDESLRGKMALEILDRAGVGKLQKLETKHTHEIVMPRAGAERITRALEMTQNVATVDYRQYLQETPAPKGRGSEEIDLASHLLPGKGPGSPDQCIEASLGGSSTPTADEKVA